jgi:hypothetical protein
MTALSLRRDVNRQILMARIEVGTCSAVVRR